MPSVAKASIMTRVSSLSSKPRKVEVPWANAAQTSARFVRLFEPGGRIEALSGAVTGIISMFAATVFGERWEMIGSQPTQRRPSIEHYFVAAIFQR
jgi:hypothetical protein